MNPKTILILCIILLIQSCTKDVDFDQIDDASIETSYIVTLVSTEFTAPDFLNELNQEISVTPDFIQTSIDDSGKDYLEKVELTVVIKNTFNRTFLLDFQMYNIEKNLLYTIQPTIEILPNSEATTILIIPQEDLHYLYEAELFGFTFVLPPTTVPEDYIQLNTIGELSLKSSMGLFFNFRNI